MVASNEFWLSLHRLADALSSEGDTRQEQTANVVEQFREMPPIVQRELIDDLVRLVIYLPDVYPQVRQAVHEVGQPPAVQEPSAAKSA